MPRARRSSVYRMRANQETFRYISRPKDARIRDRPKYLITSAIEEFLMKLLIKHNDLQQEELIFKLFVKFSVVVSQLTMSRFLRRLAFLKKVAIRVTTQRDFVLRGVYNQAISQFNAQDLVFVNKSAYSEKTMFRRTSQLAINLLAFTKLVLRYATRCSILPALTINGFLDATLVVEGSVT